MPCTAVVRALLRSWLAGAALSSALGALATNPLEIAGADVARAAHPWDGDDSSQGLYILHPFLLSDGELPDSYSVYDNAASTNAAVAFAAAPEEREAALQALLDSGRVTGLQQTLVPPGRGNLSQGQFSLSLYRGARGAANAATSAGPSVEESMLETVAPPPVSDDARAWRLPEIGAHPETYLVVWSFGTLLLAVTLEGSAATPERLSAFAVAAQAHVAGVTITSGFPQPTSKNESDRGEIQIASKLDAGQLPEGSVPAQFKRGGSFLWSNEQVVLDARKPDEMAHLVSADWGRVVAEAEYFTATDFSRARLTSVISVYRDTDGAARAGRDLFLGLNARQAVLPLDPPLQIGDQTVAYRSVVLWPLAEIRDSYTLQWLHGAAVLSVTLNLPIGQGMPAYLAEVANALDTAYLAASPLEP